MTITATSQISALLFRGRTLSKNVAEMVTAASVDASMDMASELSITLDDPGFALLRSGYFKVYTPVTYQGMNLILSVIETGAGSGRGELVLKSRPKAVHDLRKRRGKLVVNNTTASAFVQRECAAVGAKCVVEPTTKRAQIMRDVATRGQTYSFSDYPSSWTTFSRLANENGFVLFESKGVIFFASPPWLAAHRPKTWVAWSPGKEMIAKESLTIPEVRQSLDSEDIEITVELPLSRVSQVEPGNALIFQSFPQYAGTYIVTNVSYPLTSVGTVTVTAKTIRKLATSS